MRDEFVNESIYVGLSLLLAFAIAWAVKYITALYPTIIDAGVFGAVFVGLMLAKVAESRVNESRKKG